MSAPSDGARADARKARAAAETIPLALSDLLAEVSWDIEFGGRSFADQARLILASDWLAGVIADAKAEERERIVAAIERERDDPERELSPTDRYYRDWGLTKAAAAARIEQESGR